MRIEETVDSPLPVDALWLRMRDFANTQDWDPGVAQVERLDGAQVAAGTRYRVHVRMGALTVPMAYEVVSINDAARRVVLDGVGGVMRARDDISVEPRGDGSRVVWRADLALRGPLALTERVWHPAFRRVACEAMAGLRGWVG